MFKNVIGAVLGSKLAPKNPTTGSATGAVLATAVPFVLSRLSIPTMIAVGAGGYLIKRHLDKKEQESAPAEKKGASKSKASGKGKSTSSKAEDAEIINPPPAGATNGSGKSSGASASA